MVTCIMCGKLVDWPEYTLLCNECDEDNVRYANRKHRVWPWLLLAVAVLAIVVVVALATGVGPTDCWPHPSDLAP